MTQTCSKIDMKVSLFSFLLEVIDVRSAQVSWLYADVIGKCERDSDAIALA